MGVTLMKICAMRISESYVVMNTRPALLLFLLYNMHEVSNRIHRASFFRFVTLGRPRETRALKTSPGTTTYMFCISTR